MPTLQAYVTKAIDLLGSEQLLGRYVSLSSLTATTAVSNTQLAFGGNSEQRYAQWWMWRISTTTTADKIRQADSFTPSSGTLTHSGTNYSDTTATSEVLVITPPALDPYKFRTACDIAIQQIRELDETIIPVVQGQDWHWVHELDWIQDAASIRDVLWTHCPVITRNRYLQKRKTNSSGVWTPDFWTVSNNADTTPYESATYRGQKYSYALERAAATNARLSQVVSALLTGVSGDWPSGETITVVAVVDAEDIGELKLSVDAGSASDTSLNTTAALETITASATLPAGATSIEVALQAETNDSAHAVYELYACIGPLTDEIRRDDDPRYKLNDYTFEQGGPLKIRNPHVGNPGQLIIQSERPFPGFDATRLGSGAADADESDAPLVPVATGIVAICLEGMLGASDPLAKEWRRKFDAAKLKHIALETDEPGGKTFVRPPFAAPAARVR